MGIGVGRLERHVFSMFQKYTQKLNAGFVVPYIISACIKLLILGINTGRRDIQKYLHLHSKTIGEAEWPQGR